MHAASCVAAIALLLALMGGTTWAQEDEAPAEDTRSTSREVVIEDINADQCLARTEKFMVDKVRYFKKDGRSHKDLLFFLHVPRTAGRTTYGCLLRKAVPPSGRCSKSYDQLRYNDTEKSCRLLGSHDDFSIVSELPDYSAVMTMMRDPIDRLFSAYEFMVEVCARPIPRGARRNTDVMSRYKGAPPRPAGMEKRTNTRDVWPWKHLIPLVEENIWNSVYQDLINPNPNIGESLDSYNNQLVMPLETFAKHPLVNEVINNGHTFQMLGLTNYSVHEEAPQIRWCSKYPEVQDLLVDEAKKLIEKFAFVGITNFLEESYSLMMATLGYKVDGPAYSATSTARDIDAFNYDDEQQALPGAAGQDGVGGGRTPPQIGDGKKKVETVEEQRTRVKSELQEAKANVRVAQYRMYKSVDEKNSAMSALKAVVEEKEAMVAALSDPTSKEVQSIEAAIMKQNEVRPDHEFLHSTGLGQTIRGCMGKQSVRQSEKKKRALSNLHDTKNRSVSFSYAKRRDIDPAVLDVMMQLNSMDMRLHEHAVALFRSRHEEYVKRGTLEVVPAPKRPDLVNHERAEHHKFNEGGPFAGRVGTQLAGGEGGADAGVKGFDRNIPPQGPKGSAPGYRKPPPVDIFEDVEDLAAGGEEGAAGGAEVAEGGGAGEPGKDEL